MAIRSASLSNIIEPAIIRTFDMDRPVALQRNLRRTQLYNVIPSATATEEVVGLGNVSPDSFNVFKETGAIGSASMIEDYKTTFTHQEYPLDIEIPKTLIEDNKLDIVQLLLDKVRNALERKMEEDAASVFINAFDATNYPIADGVALCSNSHPLSPADSSNVQDNLSTSPFAYAALKAARVAMKKFTDHNSRRMFLMPDAVILPVDILDKAQEIINAEGKPGGADNDDNAVRGTTFWDWAALTDTNDWFVVDQTAMRDSLLWFNRGMDDPMLIYEDTVKVVYQIKARYSYGATDWRWIYGHQVS